MGTEVKSDFQEFDETDRMATGAATGSGRKRPCSSSRTRLQQSRRARV
jgi:hypothetical protein